MEYNKKHNKRHEYVHRGHLSSARIKQTTEYSNRFSGVVLRCPWKLKEFVLVYKNLRLLIPPYYATIQCSSIYNSLQHRWCLLWQRVKDSLTSNYLTTSQGP